MNDNFATKHDAESTFPTLEESQNMTKEKSLYKTAMKDLREIVEPAQVSLLADVERYMGELRRKSAGQKMQIATLKSRIVLREAEISDLKPLLSLRQQIADLQTRNENLSYERDELRTVVKEWQEIDEEASTFINVKVKCLRCSLHFIICTEHPEQHTTKSIVCPECGQRKRDFIIWKTVPEERFIFQSVPGSTMRISEFGPAPKGNTQSEGRFSEASDSAEYPFVTHDFAVVQREMLQRFGTDFDIGLPIRFVCGPDTLEVLYLQKEPRLGFWAKYRTQDEFMRCVESLKARMPNANTETDAGDTNAPVVPDFFNGIFVDPPHGN